MVWLPLLTVLAGAPGGNLTPLGTASSDATSYVVSLGLAGIGLAVYFFCFTWPGWLTKKARDEARADLLEENQRLRTELDGARAEAKDARTETKELQDSVRNQIVPAMIQFTAAADAWKAILQAQIQGRGGDGGGKPA